MNQRISKERRKRRDAKGRERRTDAGELGPPVDAAEAVGDKREAERRAYNRVRAADGEAEERGDEEPAAAPDERR